jgi:hypothetical protein
VDPKRSVKLGNDCPSGARLDKLIDTHRGVGSLPKHDYPACALFRGGRCTCDTQTDTLPPEQMCLSDREKLLADLADAWGRRREGQGYRPGTMTHAKSQLEFFMGVHAALEALGLPGIEGELLMVSIGCDSMTILRDRKPKA